VGLKRDLAQKSRQINDDLFVCCGA